MKKINKGKMLYIIVSFILIVSLLGIVGINRYNKINEKKLVKVKSQKFLQDQLITARNWAIKNGANESSLISLVKVSNVTNTNVNGLYKVSLRYFYANGSEYYPNVGKAVYATNDLIFEKYYKLSGSD